MRAGAHEDAAVPAVLLLRRADLEDGVLAPPAEVERLRGAEGDAIDRPACVGQSTGGACFFLSSDSSATYLRSVSSTGPGEPSSESKYLRPRSGPTERRASGGRLRSARALESAHLEVDGGERPVVAVHVRRHDHEVFGEDVHLRGRVAA